MRETSEVGEIWGNCEDFGPQLLRKLRERISKN